MSTNPDKGDTARKLNQQEQDDMNAACDVAHPNLDERFHSKVAAKKSRKKSRASPKQPLSAYNIFYQHEREKTLQGRAKSGGDSSRGKMGLAELTRSIAEKWKTLDESTKAYFDGLAARDKVRFSQEKQAWKDKIKSPPAETAIAASSTIHSPLIHAVVEQAQSTIRHPLDIPSPMLSECTSQRDQFMPVFEPVDSNPEHGESLTYSHRVTSSGSGSHRIPSSYGMFESPLDSPWPNEEVDYSVSEFTCRARSYSELDRTFAQSEDVTSYCYFCLGGSLVCTCPLPVTNMRQSPSIAELASHLDNESIDVIIGLLDTM